MKANLIQQVAFKRAMHKLVHGRRRPLKAKPKAQVPPKTIEMMFAGFILRQAQPAVDRVRALLPRLKFEVDRINASLKVDSATTFEHERRIAGEMRADALSDIAGEFDVVRLGMDGTMVSNSLRSAIREFGDRTQKYQGSQLQKQIKTALGVELPSNANFNERLNNFTTENIALIKSVPNKYLEQVQQAVMSGATSGQRWEEIEVKLGAIDDSLKARAGLIARDQIGKFYGSVQQARQKDLGITSYIWETAGDERVREEHQRLDGKTFEWSDPPDEGHPGQAINCRCTATPNFEQAMAELEPQVEEQQVAPQIVEESPVDVEEPIDNVEG